MRVVAFVGSFSLQQLFRYSGEPRTSVRGEPKKRFSRSPPGTYVPSRGFARLVIFSMADFSPPLRLGGSLALPLCESALALALERQLLGSAWTSVRGRAEPVRLCRSSSLAEARYVFNQLAAEGPTPQASHSGSRGSSDPRETASFHFLISVSIPKGCQIAGGFCFWHPWRGAGCGNGRRFPVVSAALRPPATRLASLRLADGLETFHLVLARQTRTTPLACRAPPAETGGSTVLPFLPALTCGALAPSKPSPSRSSGKPAICSCPVTLCSCPVRKHLRKPHGAGRKPSLIAARPGLAWPPGAARGPTAPLPASSGLVSTAR